MLASITQQYKDLSTPDNFAFVFCCDRCDKEWQSEIYALNLRGFELPLNEKIRCMLWNQQHDEAYERANLEAISHFNRCPECSRMVCDNCFCILEEWDLCKDCAKTSLKGTFDQ